MCEFLILMLGSRVYDCMFVICVSCNVSLICGLNTLTLHMQFSAISVDTIAKSHWKPGAVHALSLTQHFFFFFLTHLIQSVLTPQPNESLELSMFSLCATIFFFFFC